MTSAADKIMPLKIGFCFRKLSLAQAEDEYLGIQPVQMPEIVVQAGKSYDERKLQKYLHMIDPKNSGYLDREVYNNLKKRSSVPTAKLDEHNFLFERFVTNAIMRVAG